jgi:hypothetical protein
VIEALLVLDLRWQGKEFNRAPLIKICEGINNLAPQYGLPPIRLVTILPKDEQADIYPVKFYLDGVERPLVRYYSSDRFEDEVDLRNSIWGEYLGFISVWGVAEHQDILRGVYVGGDWVVFVYHTRLDARLSVSFFPYERGEKYIKLKLEARKGAIQNEEILAGGEWGELLPQFLYWYCYLQRAEPKEIERLIGLALL